MSFRYCPLFSGSSGNAAYLQAGKTQILLDAGLSGSAVSGALGAIGVSPGALAGILVTHEHSDHIQGVGVLSRKYDLPVYANEGTWQAMLPKIGEVRYRNIRIIETGRDFYIGELGAHPFLLPHDAAEPVGYTFCHSGHKISILTDLGHVPETFLDILENSDLLLLESNHDVDMLKNGRYAYPLKQRILGAKGHLSNLDAGKALIKLCNRKTRRVILGHLSRENNAEQLALDTVCSVLRAAGVRPGKDVQLFMAHRDRAAGLFTMGSSLNKSAAASSPLTK